jgi:hypothetical protein
VSGGIRLEDIHTGGASDGDVPTYDAATDKLVYGPGGGAGYTDEQVRDVIGAALVGGTDITITVSDAGDTITIDSTAAAGSPSTPTLVDTAVAFVNNANSGSITLPAGIAAGDGIFLFTGHGFGATLPAGYVQVDAQSGTNVGGAVFFKVAVAGDAGATQNVSFAGTYFGEIAVAVVRGMGRIRTIGAVRATSGSSQVVSGPQAGLGDLALYWGYFRASSTTVSISRGTVDRQRTADSNAGCVLGHEALASPGPITCTFTSSVGTTSGYYVALITIDGA